MNNNLAYKEEFLREELIGGKIVATVFQSMDHSRVSGNIFVIVKASVCLPGFRTLS